MNLRRIDTVDGSRGVYDGDRWVATFKRVADLEDYLRMRSRIEQLEDLARRILSFKGRRAPWSVPQRLWDEFRDALNSGSREGRDG